MSVCLNLYDFNHEKIKQKLEFFFQNNTRTFSVDLIGTMRFPNINFSETGSIDFGTLMKNTESIRR